MTASNLRSFCRAGRSLAALALTVASGLACAAAPPRATSSGLGTLSWLADWLLALLGA